MKEEVMKHQRQQKNTCGMTLKENEMRCFGKLEKIRILNRNITVLGEAGWCASFIRNRTASKEYLTPVFLSPLFQRLPAKFQIFTIHIGQKGNSNVYVFLQRIFKGCYKSSLP